jgi:O-antigen/teichoic acid export membrane protein
MRWADRSIAFVSTLILARLLVPEDFGLIAMASLVIGLADVFFELGVNVALIQNRTPSQEHYDTAWTLRIIRTTLAAIVVVLAAPLAATYFNDQRVTLVVQVLAVSLMLSGLENIGVVTFQKEMQFGREFQFLFCKRIVGFIATVVAAWFIRSYWAMVIGALAGRTFGVALSFAMHPMRPHLSLKKFGEIFSVSQWMLVRSIGGYLELKLHYAIVGARESASVLGAYSLGSEISALPTSELLAPVNRVLFPAFVRVKDDLVELKRVVLLAQGVQTMIAMPAAIGLILVSSEAVLLLLGEKWMSAVPFVEIFALISFLTSIATSGWYVLLTLGKIRLIAISSWVQVGLFATLSLVVFPEAGAVGLAWLYLAVVTLWLIALTVLLVRHLEGLRFAEIASSITRPLIAVSIMALCVILVSSATNLDG